jgi:histidinol dehydrogenase
VSYDLKEMLISFYQPDFDEKFSALRRKVTDAAIWLDSDPKMQSLRDIVSKVSTGGDEAVAEFTKRFDEVELRPEEFRVGADELAKAHKDIDADLLAALRQAIGNVRKYQTEIFTGNNTHPGVKYAPMKRVAVCVPGASAPLPSTVIMSAVPAQVAGVEEIVVISPPRCNGSINPVILAVCHELGIKEVYRIGGSQAVSAMAYGTETIRKVNMIVGPGNMWVTMAKREVFGKVAIDSIAGPSEVLVIADENANPAWVTADMLSQAEHAFDSSAFVFTDSQKFAEEVITELKKQVKELDRGEETQQSLVNYSGVIVFENMDDVIDAANDFATEHLQINCGDKSRSIADKIVNAGAIFIGPYTPIAVGDYWAGPSHTLPTGASAKFFSPLSSNDFVKSTSIIEYSSEQLKADGEKIVLLAETEGLDAHAKSISIRIK